MSRPSLKSSRTCFRSSSFFDRESPSPGFVPAWPGTMANGLLRLPGECPTPRFLASRLVELGTDDVVGKGLLPLEVCEKRERCCGGSSRSMLSTCARVSVSSPMVINGLVVSGCRIRPSGCPGTGDWRGARPNRRVRDMGEQFGSMRFSMVPLWPISDTGR